MACRSGAGSVARASGRCTHWISSVCTAFERLLLLGSRHGRDHEGPHPWAQLFQAAADGRQRRFVADQQVPIEIVRHDEGTAWPADLQRLPGGGLRGPLRRGTGLVQREVHRERAGRRIVAAGRVVAHGRRLGAVLAGRREEQLDVIVVAGADEAGEIVALERDADHPGGEPLGRLDGQQAAAQLMADTADRVPFGTGELVHVRSTATAAASRAAVMAATCSLLKGRLARRSRSASLRFSMPRVTEAGGAPP